MLREHGPRDPMMLLLLHTLRTFMDDDGSCYPSQETIALAAGVSSKTVRNKLPVASRLHWVGMKSHATSGTKWPWYSYRACIPDWVVLDNDKYEKLADTWASQHGEVDEDELNGGLVRKKATERGSGASRPAGMANAIKAPMASRERATIGISGQHHRNVAEEAPAHEGQDHRNIGERAPEPRSYKLFSENSDSKTLLKQVFKEEGRVDAQSGADTTCVSVAATELIKALDIGLDPRPLKTVRAETPMERARREIDEKAMHARNAGGAL